MKSYQWILGDLGAKKAHLDLGPQLLRLENGQDEFLEQLFVLQGSQ